MPWAYYNYIGKQQYGLYTISELVSSSVQTNRNSKADVVAIGSPATNMILFALPLSAILVLKYFL